MPATYSFVSRWRLPVPPERAWHELVRTLRPGAGVAWWPGFSLTMAPRRLASGERMIVAVRSPLGYTLRCRLEISDVDPGRAIEVRSDGDLRGWGSAEVRAAVPGGAAGAVVVLRWDVETRRAWMNATAWLLRPAFERAHGRVMRRGEEGLLRALREEGASEVRNAGNPRLEEGSGAPAG